jgi:anti-anti-sigma factor
VSAAAEQPGAGELRVVPERTPAAVVLRVGGELDLAGAPRLGEAVQAVQESADAALVIDLSGVTFMDSTGVRALVDAGRVCRESGRPLALLSPSPQVTRVLDLVDLRRAFVEIADLGEDSLARAASPDL